MRGIFVLIVVITAYQTEVLTRFCPIIIQILFNRICLIKYNLNQTGDVLNVEL